MFKMPPTFPLPTPVGSGQWRGGGGIAGSNGSGQMRGGRDGGNQQRRWQPAEAATANCRTAAVAWDFTRSTLTSRAEAADKLTATRFVAVTAARLRLRIHWPPPLLAATAPIRYQLCRAYHYLPSTKSPSTGAKGERGGKKEGENGEEREEGRD